MKVEMISKMVLSTRFILLIFVTIKVSSSYPPPGILAKTNDKQSYDTIYSQPDDHGFDPHETGIIDPNWDGTYHSDPPFDPNDYPSYPTPPDCRQPPIYYPEYPDEPEFEYSGPHEQPHEETKRDVIRSTFATDYIVPGEELQPTTNESDYTPEEVDDYIDEEGSEIDSIPEMDMTDVGGMVAKDALEKGDVKPMMDMAANGINMATNEFTPFLSRLLNTFNQAGNYPSGSKSPLVVDNLLSPKIYPVIFVFTKPTNTTEFIRKVSDKNLYLYKDENPKNPTVITSNLHEDLQPMISSIVERGNREKVVYTV